MENLYLIAVEGIDGSGKTTLVHILENYFVNKGFQVTALTSGGTDPTGIEAQLKSIVTSGSNNCTPNTELLLYFASLSQKYGQFILPALREKKIIIVDRYIHSYIVFSKCIYHQDDSFTNMMINFTTNNYQPNFLFLCDLDENVAFSRLQSRKRLSKREQQGTNLLSEMRKGFLNEYENHNGRKMILHTDVDTISDLEEKVNAWGNSIFV